MNFAQIKGQDFAINNLKNFIKTGKVPPAMIFYGPAGVGKAKVAMAFAQALNCQNLGSDFEPCQMCQSCKQIEAKTHPDIIFADYAYQAALLKEEVEDQQNIKIETVRSLTTASQQKAVAATWKVFTTCRGALNSKKRCPSKAWRIPKPWRTSSAGARRPTRRRSTRWYCGTTAAGR